MEITDRLWPHNTQWQRKEAIPMLERNQQLLQTLKKEWVFFKSGGYGHPFRGRWRPTLLFRDSATCVNYSANRALKPCQECPLFALVPSDKRNYPIPCHHIPLDFEGNTIARLYQSGSQEALDQIYFGWLSAVVNRLEEH
jgi:hypothetical protein